MTEFLTNDLQLASYLVALGHELCRIEGTPERRCFVLADVPQADITDYHRGTRPIAPVALFAAYRRLKRQLFQ